MAHGNYHWLLFTIYLYTPHGQQQYTLRKKKTLYVCRERNDAFRISAGLLRAVVLIIGRVKWSEFYSAFKKIKKREVNVNKVTTSCNGRKRKQRAASSEIGSPWRETRTGSVSWDFPPPEHLNCERTSQLVENLA